MRLIYNNEQKKSEIETLTCLCVCVCVREREALVSEDPNTFHLSLFLEAEAANKEKHPLTTRSSTQSWRYWQIILFVDGVWLR